LKGLPDGSSDNPYRVVSSEVFSSLADKGNYIVLDSDLEMTSHIDILSSEVNGNGKTMYIRNFNGPLLGRISESGSLRNINIVIENSTLNVTEAFAFVTVLNSGIIENVNVTIKNSSVNVVIPGEVTEAENTTYIGILSAVNSGTIKDCSVSCSSMNITGYEHINGYISCIASMNAGYISGCSAEGDMLTDTVDTAGITAENMENGIIEKCVNKMNIRQVTSSSAWNPNIGGIAGLNKGIVTSCVNYGNLKGESLTMLEDIQEGEPDPDLTVLIGGIVAQNMGRIDHVINAGNITASSSKTNSFAGGITAYSSGTMEWCGSKGELSVRTEDKYISCVGGIAGRIDGTGSCKNGYSLSVLSLSGESTNKYSGGVCGA
ncbi:MAG: hypothetical protein MJ068_05435, partial [Clostridia bacterium]|nr:hypothetical protein [Clostridia bacterium]